MHTFEQPLVTGFPARQHLEGNLGVSFGFGGSLVMDSEKSRSIR